MLSFKLPLFASKLAVISISCGILSRKPYFRGLFSVLTILILSYALVQVLLIYMSSWQGSVTTRCIRSYPFFGSYMYVQIRDEKTGELKDKGPVRGDFWDSTLRTDYLFKNKFSRVVKKKACLI
jgi:hypothetical protein